MSELGPPARPNIPLAFWALLGAYLGFELAFEYALDLRKVLALIGLFALAFLLFLRLTHLFNADDLQFVLVLEIACLALLVSYIRTAQLRLQAEEAAATLRNTPMSEFEFVVVGNSSVGEWGTTTEAMASLQGAELARVQLKTSEPFDLGAHIRLRGAFLIQVDNDYAKALQKRGVVGTVRTYSIEDKSPYQGLLGVLYSFRAKQYLRLIQSGSDSRALLSGLFFGDRSLLRQRSLTDLFSLCGISHMLAVSGSHLSAVALLLNSMFEGMGLFPKKRIAFVLGASWLFVLFCAEPLSAVRAWFVCAVSLVGSALGKRGDGLAATCIVALALGITNPYCFGEAGFKLSVCCVLGIQLFSAYADYALKILLPDEIVKQHLPKSVRIRGLRAYSSARRCMAASLCALLSSLPFTQELFGEFSVLSPLTNLLVSPVFPWIQVVALLAGLFGGLPGVGNVLLAVWDGVAYQFLLLMRVLSRIPVSMVSIQVPSSVVVMCIVSSCVALYLSWPCLKARYLRIAIALPVLIAISIFIRWRYFAPARIVVLDVGQGDAIAIQDGPSCVLVDVGPDSSITQALLRNHIYHVDSVVVTHLHSDHYAGIMSFSGHVRPAQVVFAYGALGSIPDELNRSLEELGCSVEELYYGEELRAGDFRLEVVWPREAVDGLANEDSLVLLLTYSSEDTSLSALLTGDAEQDVLSEVIEGEQISQVDFLKLGHHGSEASISTEEAKLLQPLLSVASAGKDNSYGHPSDACIEVVLGSGSAFLCTKDVGDVYIFPSREGLRYSTGS